MLAVYEVFSGKNIWHWKDDAVGRNYKYIYEANNGGNLSIPNIRKNATKYGTFNTKKFPLMPENATMLYNEPRTHCSRGPAKQHKQFVWNRWGPRGIIYMYMDNDRVNVDK